MAPDLTAFLDDLHTEYDPGTGMPWSTPTTPGYHTRMPQGSRVHETRLAADYALGLLQSGTDDHVERAHTVLRALLAEQDTDPVSEHYGLWGWFLEEPAARMAPADWNWADFIGARLAQIEVMHGERLHPGLRLDLGAALRHAALAIFRRNVRAGYSNIAVMGAVVTAAAAQLTADSGLLDYARRRLASVLELAERQEGEFTEYNSPPYHLVIIEELDRAALIVTDDDFRATARALHERTWATLARRFHPGTGQIAGPMSRAYHDRLDAEATDFLTGSQHRILVPAQPRTAEVSARFKALPADPHEVTTRTGGTTWLTHDACLGSAPEAIAWTQRRPLLGYWRTPEDPAVVLRARALLNGRDLAAACCRQTQQGARVLSAWWLLYNGGDFHPSLDRPEGSVYTVRDLRIAVTLSGRGVAYEELGDGRFALGAGGFRAVLTVAPGEFRGRAVSWQPHVSDGEVGVQAVLHEGSEEQLDFHQAPLRLAFGLELLPTGHHPAADALTWSSNADGQLDWTWGDLNVTAPATPTSFQRP